MPLTKIDNTVKFGKQSGGFGIQILYPGLIRPQANDTGFATLGRIDHALITPGTFIPMHPHVDDEILTYLRSGKVKHIDSEGYTDVLSNQRLMMMNAGESYFHEELSLEEGGTLEGLQIFIRPETSGLKPKVQFHDLAEIYSINHWRKIAGKSNDYPLEIRSDTWLLDMRLEVGRVAILPDSSFDNATFLLYVFAGKVQVNQAFTLSQGESLLIEQESPSFEALDIADLVLFVTQPGSTYFDGGMYSGNQKK